MEEIFEPVRNDTVAVGTASVSVCEVNKKRIVVYLRNTSTGTQVITVNFGDKNAVANQGVVLEVGDYVADSQSENYNCYKGKVFAVASAASAQLSVMERGF